MVLVRVDVPLRPKNLSVANDEQSSESSFAKAPLPRAANGSSLPIEPPVETEPISSPQATASRESLPPYHSQLKLLEQQNKKRLLMVRQEMAEREHSQDNGSKRASIDSNATSRENIYMQQMVLEQENGKRLIGARHQLAGQAPGANDSRNQGHDAQAIAASYQQTDSVSFMNPLMSVEQNQRQSGLAEQLRTPTSYEHIEDNWGKGPFPAGQGVIAGYQAQLALLENERRQAAAEQSQAEAEIFRLSGRLPPGAPGSSCAPPEPHPAYM